jgi:hypothetical protein
LDTLGTESDHAGWGGRTWNQQRAVTCHEGKPVISTAPPRETVTYLSVNAAKTPHNRTLTESRSKQWESFSVGTSGIYVTSSRYTVWCMGLSAGSPSKTFRDEHLPIYFCLFCCLGPFLRLRLDPRALFSLPSRPSNGHACWQQLSPVPCPLRLPVFTPERRVGDICQCPLLEKACQSPPKCDRLIG